MRFVVALLVLALAACTTELERGLSEASADEIVVTLADHGIGATKEAERGSGRFGVRVLESEVPAALSVLRDEGLPREVSPSLAESFAEPSLIPTAGEERARLAAALASDLERTIESLDGVHAARVHVGLPDPSAVPLDEQPEPRVASVLVRRDAGAVIDEAAIRTLVAGAVPGLSTDHVSVVTVEHAASAARPLVHLGPITVTEGSVTPLKVIVGVLLLFNVLAIAGAAFALRRVRARA
jgi:type III secretion protein J